MSPERSILLAEEAEARQRFHVHCRPLLDFWLCHYDVVRHDDESLVQNILRELSKPDVRLKRGCPFFVNQSQS